jgi:hypothetical protein
MIRTTATLAGLFTLATAAGAQQYQVEVTPDTASVNARFVMFCLGSGSLIGDWDAITNPDGTRTKPGVTGLFEPGENEPVPATPWLVHGDGFTSFLAGDFGFEVDAFFERVEVTTMALDVLGGADIDLPLASSLSHEAFRTKNPDATFPASTTAHADVAGGRLIELTFTQTGEAEGTHVATGPFTAEFAVTVPGVISGSFAVAESTIVLPDVTADLRLDGQILNEGESIRLVGIGRLVGAAQGAGGQAWMAPIELDIPGGGGAAAGLLASATIDEIIADFLLEISDFEAAPVEDCYADCNSDGELTIFDFLCYQGVYASGAIEADCDKDGELTVFDFLCYLNLFDAGCP